MTRVLPPERRGRICQDTGAKYVGCDHQYIEWWCYQHQIPGAFEEACAAFDAKAQRHQDRLDAAAKLAAENSRKAAVRRRRRGRR